MSKKQTSVARSNSASDHGVMSQATYELLWVRNFLKVLDFPYAELVKLRCDNHVAVHIAYFMFFMREAIVLK